MKFVNLNAHSTYSLLNGLSKPADIIKRAIKIGSDAIAITDHTNISASVQIIKASKEVCKCGFGKNFHSSGKGGCKKSGCEKYEQYKIKPILGCDIYLCKEDSTIKEQSNRRCSRAILLARNVDGWKNLIKTVSKSNAVERYYYNPRLKLEEIESKNLIAITGYMDSDLANCLFVDIDEAYRSKTYDAAKALVVKDWEASANAVIDKYISIFGQDNFFIAIQLIDSKNIPAMEIVAKILRHIAKKRSLVCVAVGSPYYPERDDAKDHRIILASSQKTSLQDCASRLENSKSSFGLSAFFKSNNYHIPSIEDLVSCGNTIEEIENTDKVSQLCESYDITAQPKLPQIECPNGMSPDEYLRLLCYEGWKKYNVPADKKTEYAARVKEELDVFKEYGLSSYFLIVRDYCRYAKDELKILIGCGRGSVGGSLVASLIGITDKTIDPIKYDLYFSRFINKGRLTPGKISLPDIDCDFPVEYREQIVEYIVNKYGRDRVSQIVTFGGMKGRGAIKDVLRAHQACDFTKMNVISKGIVQEAAITDDLQEMKDERGESSIIQWSLENTPDSLKEYCYLNKDGELEGDYAQYFAQAIRLEGCKRNKGKHAAGIVISPVPIGEICPLIYDEKTKTLVAGFEMADLESVGCVKFDILGILALDKLMGYQKLMAYDRIEPKKDIEVFENDEEDE